jgi:hypothetical protein
MTATTLPARPPRAAARVVVLPAAGRLLWIEVKRNAVPWVLPLLAVLVYLDTYRTVSGYPPVWTVRALAVPDRLLVDFAAFAGGFSAWAGSREGRRKTEDLLGTTVRPAWTRQLAALAGTMFWLVLAFLAAVAVLYIQIARAAAWGGPPLWPVAVGLVALVTICVAGFTAGALFPGRFTAPLVAVGAVVLHLVGTHAVNDPDTPSLHDLLSLGTNVPPYDGLEAQQIPLIIETGAAAAIAVTSHGPFGEPERATGRWLPYLRLGTALALTGLAIGMLQLAVTGASLNEGLLVLARNVLGLTGLGLLTSLATGGLLAWTLPLGYLAFAQYALLQAWRSPWLWPVRPPADRGAWICASLVFAAGLLAFTVRGPRPGQGQ